MIETIMTNFLELRVDKFIFKVADDRFYNAQGCWAIAAEHELVRVGLSDFLQQHSGDVVFANVKPVGTVLAAGSEVAEIETIKVNFSLSSPLAGTIVRVNPLMETAPETINQDSYQAGWVCEIEAAGWEADRKNLLEPAAYFVLMQREAENEAKSS
jgi:glycine cleavage system H protein